MPMIEPHSIGRGASVSAAAIRYSRRKGNSVRGRSRRMPNEIPDSAASEAARWAASIEAVALRRDRDAFAASFAHFAPRIKTFMSRSGASAQSADESAQSDERVRVAHYLDSSAKRILAAQKSQPTWADAMRHAVLGDDPVWTRTYLGYFFWGSQRADHVFSVRADGSSVRGWERGEDAPADRYAGSQTRVARSIARTRGESRDDGDIAQWITLEDGKWP
ncbi:hypothetical protein OY671_008670, partial [Metschnikowia pulcherrima]